MNRPSIDQEADTTRRRKIVIVDRLGAFSIWTLMDAVAAAAVSAGHEVVQVVLDTGADAEIGERRPPDGVRVVPIRVASGRSRGARLSHAFAFARQFAILLRAERPDVVHTNFADPGIVARTVARLMGLPLVVTSYHELRGSLNRSYQAGLAATAWCAHRHVYVSATCARSFGHPVAPIAEAPHMLPADRHVVIRNGFIFRPPRAAAGPSSGERPRLVVAGRLMPEKGQLVLVDAVRRLADDGHSVDVEILGDGPLRQALEQRIAVYALGDRIKLRGWCPHDEVMSAFASADAVVIPSDGSQESFGLVLAEAMAIAGHVIVSDIAPFREVASCLQLPVPPVGLAFFRPGDAQDLATKLCAALVAPLATDDLARRRAAVVEHLDLCNMARIYLAVYGAGNRFA